MPLTKHILLPLFGALFTLLIAPPPALAHQTGKSTLRCAADLRDGMVRCQLTLSGDDLAHYLQLDQGQDRRAGRADLLTPAHSQAALAHLRDQLRVHNAAHLCEPLGEGALSATPMSDAHVEASLDWRCPLPWRSLRVTDAIMVNTPGGYRHLGLLSAGERQMATVFDAAHIDAELPISDAPAQDTGLGHTLARYIEEGLLHILGGADHVLFVLVLALGATSARRLLGTVTAFTLAHSLTLAISALGWATPPAALIEPLIALSILITAAMAARRAYRAAPDAPRTDPSWAASLAAPALFGLLHGFGFSYVLRDEVGLPTQALIPALGAFNVGVELGQLLILALAIPALAALRARSPATHRSVVLICCALLGAVALYWTIARTLLA
jgi:hydrogenase/urease accessory protein HupE